MFIDFNEVSYKSSSGCETVLSAIVFNSN